MRRSDRRRQQAIDSVNALLRQGYTFKPGVKPHVAISSLADGGYADVSDYLRAPQRHRPSGRQLNMAARSHSAHRTPQPIDLNKTMGKESVPRVRATHGHGRR